MPSRKTRDWGELSQGQKDYYREKGITAGPYNRWWTMPQTERTALTKQAKAAGYESGLQFTAVQSQVRAQSGKRITPRTRPNEAARYILKGSKGKADRDRQHRKVAKLFDFEEFERVEWEEFMSPGLFEAVAA